MKASLRLSGNPKKAFVFSTEPEHGQMVTPSTANPFKIMTTANYHFLVIPLSAERAGAVVLA